jgi:adenylate kinase
MTFATVTRKLKRAARIILVGAPGVGKGTQSERLMKRFPQLCSIATGDLLRENVTKQTALGMTSFSMSATIKYLHAWLSGQQAEAHMKAGGLVPDPLILNLILSELTSRKWLETKDSNERIIAALGRGNGSASRVVHASESPDSSFILDGFPRTSSQGRALAHLLPINLVLHLVTPVDIILSRMANRWTHIASGRVYNVGFNDPQVPGRDDITGDPLVQREDDTEATWRKRLAKFEETSEDLLSFYREQEDNLVVKVGGNSSDEISPQIFTEIERRFG